MVTTLSLARAQTDPHTRRALADLSLSVAKCKKIVVVTGAGISCSSGIPDFRSSDGLYNLVKQQYPDVVLKGRDLFDSSLFRDPATTSVFYTFISQLKQSIDAATPTPTHHFIKTLDTKKKLLRSYTQNIDGLEDRVGLPSKACAEAQPQDGKTKGKTNAKNIRNVQLHGDIHRVRCVACSADFPCTPEHLKLFNDGTPADCPDCLQRSEARVARSARATRVGVLRPAIVLYDEPHPLGDDIGTMQTHDLARKPDMLIIMGTSLKVHGLKKLVKEFAKAIHSVPSTSKAKAWSGKVVFVNKTPPGSEWAGVIDYHVAGDTDTWVARVLEDWKRMRPADWETQQTLTTSNGTLESMKVVKASTGQAGKGKPKNTKKPAQAHGERENVPPPVIEEFSADEPSCHRHTVSKLVTPPSSPSKRRRAISHYSDVESSPTKKQNQSPRRPGPGSGSRDPFDEVNVDRSMLDMTASPTKTDKEVDVDLSMLDVNSPPRKQKIVVPAKKLTSSTSAETVLGVGRSRAHRAFGRTRSRGADVFA